MTDFASKTSDQISSLERTISSPVQHFMIPQSVSNIFMGRELESSRLDQAVEKFKSIRGTKTVVIYGIGGAGKSQFCCKYAQDNRSR